MTDAPELPAELFAQLWGEALQLYPDARVVPGLACTEVARLAYAAGWEARGAVKDSLTTPEELSVVGAPQAEGSVTWWLPFNALPLPSGEAADG